MWARVCYVANVIVLVPLGLVVLMSECWLSWAVGFGSLVMYECWLSRTVGFGSLVMGAISSLIYVSWIVVARRPLRTHLAVCILRYMWFVDG